jgi:hypothetical protein
MRERRLYGSARGAPSNGRPYRDRHAFPISRPSVCATPLITNHDIKLPFPPTSVSPHALLCICKLPK